MNWDDFDAHFDRFTSTVFRLETLQNYAGEDERLRAFRLGTPLPERSVRTSPWLARIATSTITQGKQWQRVRVVEEPLTDYTRYEMASYVESQAAGEEIRILRNPPAPMRGDFWLFDPGTLGGFALKMIYDDDGQLLNVELVTHIPSLMVLSEVRNLALQWSVPLNEYLAGKAAKAA